MKQSLQVGLSQQLTLTPQLQQAIRLLQLSSIELSQEVQEALDSNLMLELQEHSNNEDLPYQTENQAIENSHDGDVVATEASTEEWEKSYNQTSAKGEAVSQDYLIEHNTNHDLSLQEHLVWQMRLSKLSEPDMAIATALIDSIDNSGFLRSSLQDICDSVNGDDTEGENEIEFDDVIAVLKLIQRFDPVGVGARDLAECLSLQLQALDHSTPWLETAKELITNHFALLAGRNYKKLTRELNISQDELQETLKLIRSLNPKPGLQISREEPEYIVPDVIVKKVQNRWLVELNPELMPKLRINNDYAGLVQRGKQTDDNVFLKNQLQEARWLLKSLHSRHDTLLKVATCIVKHQVDFFEHGEEAMKPLILHDIAEAIEMHESTISRVTTRKYMHTPRGVFELKYFFSSHLSTNSGGECSSTAIRAFIKKVIGAENSMKPLSDNKIAQLLAEQGIKVARRTVAKYREAMAIPPSNERKYLTEE